MALAEFPDLSEMVLRGALQQLGDVFNLPASQVNFYSSTNRLQLAMRVQQLLNSQQQSIVWPQLFVHVNSIAVGEMGTNTSYSAKQLSRRGIFLQLADNENKVSNVPIIPAAFSVEVTFMTDNFFTAMRFATRWLLSASKNAFNFSLTFGSVDIDIHADAETTVSTPDRDEAVNHPNVYEYTCNMTIWGYINGDLRQVPMLNKTVVGTIPGMPPTT